MKKVLLEAEKKITPSKKEEQMVRESVEAVTQTVESAAKKLRLNVDLFEGGSIAKNTWLPGISDMDFFLRFEYKNKDLSSLAEKLLKKCFKIKRLHGSRDYFKTHHFGFDIEFVPVLRISKYQQAKNITDISPLHVYWLKKQYKKKPKLHRDIRLAKQFFKAAGVYGAESYIRGFSGYVIEILTVYYGSFEKLIKAISNWKGNLIIDVCKFHKSKQDVLRAINQDKRVGPLIVVDSIEPFRNASSVVSKEKFDKLIKYCNKFLRNPRIDMFSRDWLTKEDVKKQARGRALILMRAKPENDKIDVAGAKILKQFEFIQRALEENDFKILKMDWQWNKRDDALLWIYLNPRILPIVKRHFGPPIKMKQHARAFKKQWRNVKVSKGRLFVDLKREFRSAKDIIKALKKVKELRNFKFL